MLNPYVLHISKWYPNKEDDLEGVFIQRHIKAISPRFNSIVFFAKTSPEKSTGLYSIVQRDDGNVIEYSGYYKKCFTGIAIIDKAVKAILYFYIMNRLLRVVIKKFGKPFAIHAHVLLRPVVVAYWFSIKLKLPFVITEHSTYYTSNKRVKTNSFKNLLRRFFVKKAKAVITVSEDLESGMKEFKLFNENYYRVFNSVNTNHYHFRDRPEHDFKNLLHVSEFKNEHKNIIGMLEVIKLLHQSEYRFMLHLAGYGQDQEEILAYIARHKLDKCIQFHGKCNEEQLGTLYSEADVFILFSNKENMPCVIAESLCCGTPVISTRVGGIPEVINETNGILVERGNQQQLQNGIHEVLRNERTFDRKQIAKNAVQLFSSQSIGIQLSEIYSGCLQNK